MSLILRYQNQEEKLEGDDNKRYDIERIIYGVVAG